MGTIAKRQIRPSDATRLKRLNEALELLKQANQLLEELYLRHEAQLKRNRQEMSFFSCDHIWNEIDDEPSSTNMQELIVYLYMDRVKCLRCHRTAWISRQQYVQNLRDTKRLAN